MEPNLTLGMTLCVQLLAAIVLAIPTAWNREVHSRVMGLRTFPLVSLGACAYVVIGQAFIGPDAPDAMARLVQGIIAGIGFVGGGAILKNDDYVKGTVSAASIWVTGAVGAAVGFRLWLVAILLCALNFLVILAMSYVKHVLPKDYKGP